MEKDNSPPLAFITAATLGDAWVLGVIWVVARVHIAILALGAASTRFPKANTVTHGQSPQFLDCFLEHFKQLRTSVGSFMHSIEARTMRGASYDQCRHGVH
jgi:hypothetical protein